MKDIKTALLQAMESTGMIPVFNHSDTEVAKSVLAACYAAGVRVFEFTNRNANSLEVFMDLKAYAASFPGLYLGIGTIFTQVQAERFVAVGADFIVSPALIPEVAALCKAKGVFWVPGCGTITEINEARKLGATLVKAFPGNVLGPEFIAAAKSVIPELRYMPTGGVEPSRENLKKWFDSGVTCVGMGSQLFRKQWINDRKFGKIEYAVAEALAVIKNFID
ncbi:bifunctional 4-hydroxy-2-oxoglutarate aldolase/2-dehydro-3-deoxy-phosphogluconate aldolase [Algoriphagus sp. H41]|uniref:Bifunctional 4-hydroxy-2-oxoglutarate aldolase/2-dehydro-3-deoxy-phosphogluconate aldolase n=1 Tax=Algoriphagus oliviformis TaxID=2811231 RepID=A0ABS3BY25_9BACT|nr:bifunctional 4-hydroxy-2-oxoglutarate aldolase/2-dehydro-3-deoxy-phosphogluconate aldolase [Algoriphagus oliviformis]MBN7809767.1 bifunctional 4-hydroxy-2-oxoglutarate aldolase/2-dehydro-3-deoxy-phosphogluconate aldolase [Algoriphagus oliviformis]